MPIKNGNKVKIEYTGTLEDGKIFDSSKEHGQLLVFEVGSGQVIKGFDEAVIGMEKGEEKNIKLQPSEAYGKHNPQLVKKIPRNNLPQDREPSVGMMIGVSLQTGQQIPAVITDVNYQEITIDLNPPLAGKVLNFKIKVIDYS